MHEQRGARFLAHERGSLEPQNQPQAVDEPQQTHYPLSARLTDEELRQLWEFRSRLPESA